MTKAASPSASTSTSVAGPSRRSAIRDGDLQMLQYTGAGSGTRFCLYVHHDDDTRNMPMTARMVWPNSTRASTKPAAKGWTVVSMKNDWQRVFFRSRSRAIDILLQPDATMLQHAAVNNARLLKVYPKGFALDAMHTPHITMLQCFRSHGGSG